MLHFSPVLTQSSAITADVHTGVLIVGIDEAGRGALAGPVVAAACVLPERKRFPVMIADSKQMTPEEREESYAWLTANCRYGIGSSDASTIDRVGILGATELAMQEAVLQISRSCPDLYLLVDGRDKFWFDHPHSSIVRGDQSEMCIAAASIIAKVTRDRRMVQLGLEIPGYGFDEHKGYGTPHHFTSIDQLGLSSEHRRSFLRHHQVHSKH